MDSAERDLETLEVLDMLVQQASVRRELDTIAGRGRRRKATSAYHGRQMSIGPRARDQGRGYLDADAGRALPTLWVTSWDTISMCSVKHLQNMSLSIRLAGDLSITMG